MSTPLYETITTKIIQQLEEGHRPWHKPWTTNKPSVAFKIPVNATTGKPYRGINIPLLWNAADEKGFTTNEYATFKQWSANKEVVKKGEKGNLIVFFDVMEKENDKKEIERIPFLKSSIVFNRSQLQSYTPPDPSELPPEPRDPFDRIHAVDSFISKVGAKISHDGGNRAYYSRVTDDIHLPKLRQFVGTPTQTPQESYYAVTMHELTHWSGHESRLNRKFGKRFGDQAYAFEELVAEMGSAFLCASLEITDAPRPNHASYLKSWLQVLKDDKRAILTAASKASEAMDYMFKLQDGVNDMGKPANDANSDVGQYGQFRLFG